MKKKDLQQHFNTDKNIHKKKEYLYLNDDINRCQNL